jgi:site-specific DNA-methyltransferase (adenine-specific)
MIKIINSDNIKVLKKIPDNYFHSVVTDPPYHIGFMGKKWDHVSDKNKKVGIAFDIDFWKEIYRVLRPGGYCLAFAAAKLDHRIAVAIEDAGFIIRTKLMWMYGSGFPKGQNIAKALDKKLTGKVSKNKGSYIGGTNIGAGASQWVKGDYDKDSELITDEAKIWEGWNTELKPAFEPIVMAQKPISEKTIVDNVLKWGTGAINVDACRIPLNGDYKAKPNGRPSQTGLDDNYDPTKANIPDTVGRYPANVIHDGSDEVEDVFLSFGATKDGVAVQRNRDGKVHNKVYGKYNKPAAADVGFGGGGSVSRFFYCAKVSTKDRAGSKHPTIKPMALMRYLVKLVTVPNGKVLDPFVGSGTTAIACELEGFKCIGIERDESSYQDYFKRRNYFIKTKTFYYKPGAYAKRNSRIGKSYKDHH